MNNSSFCSSKKAFGVISPSQNAGDYIYNKKTKATYCVSNQKMCVPNVNVETQGNLLLFKKSKILNRCINTIDKTNLYINLLTKLDLENVSVVEDFSGNQVPSTIQNAIYPYLRYNVDPCGNLFGNTPCGLNNYVHYMIYNSPKLVSN
jgi:hypothetical protein